MKTSFAVGIFAAVIASSMALKCYQCAGGKVGDSETNSKCKVDKMGITSTGGGLAECSSSAKYCMKTYGWSKAFGTEGHSVARTCASSCTADSTEGEIFGIPYKTDVSCCTTDNCNGATSVFPVVAVLLTSLIATLKLF